MIDYFKSRNIKVSLIPEVSLVEDSASEISLVSEYGRVPFKGAGKGILKAFRALAAGDRTEEELASIVLETGGIGELTRFNYFYAQCVVRCFIQYSVYADDTRLVSLALTVPLRSFVIAELEAEGRYALSRFAYCHRQGGELLLETPLLGSKVILHDWRAAALLSVLSTPSTSHEIAEKSPFIPDDALAGILKLLKTARLLCASADAGAPDEDQNITLRQWEFHDLLFHSRSRIGRHNNRVGATFRHLGSIPPPPLVKYPQADGIRLYQPESDRAESRMDLFEAIEARKSIRSHGKEPISSDQLGEFLYRVARIRALWNFEIRNPSGALIETFQLSNRPYPAGGAVYEIEIYITINRCKDLEPGLYRYSPLEHTLAKLSAENEKTAALLKDASLSAGINHRPQVLITLAARFQRMAWKYNTISYAATLKNVGVLYQTMYLVATAMGLAPCALGSGNSDLFAEAAGTDYYAETSVGEFMLGTLPEIDEQPPWAAEKNFIPNKSLLPRTD
jgi:SagB-type dehydrogenase family enzyme